jgi:flagellar biosynthesis protein FliP
MFAVLILMAIFVQASAAQAQISGTSLSAPGISISLDPTSEPTDLTTPIKILLLITILAMAPSILVMMTCFTRIVIVLGFLRQAMGTHQAPSSQIIVGLALFLTIFIMQPVFQKIYHEAYVPYSEKSIGYEEAGKNALAPLRAFMLKQTKEKDLTLLVKISRIERPESINDIPTFVLIPSFILSELKTAFIIGFMVYLPFLIIDMVVASILMSMGMMMLPPIMISMPFKLLIFVLADGWYLIIGSLVDSFYI